MAFQLDQQELHCSVQKFTDMCGKSLSEKFKIAVEQMFNYNTKQTSLAIDTLHCDQKLSLVMLYSLIEKDLALFASAMQIFSELYRGKFTTLENWLKDEFSFAKEDITTAVSRLAQLVSKGVLQINKQILQVFSGLELKYNLKKYFIESGDDTALGFINNLISEDKMKTPTTSQTPPNSSVISKEEDGTITGNDIQNNNWPLIGVLNTGEVDEKKEDIQEWTLPQAVKHGNIEMVGLLLKSEAVINIKSEYWKLFNSACKNGHLEIAELLVKHKASLYTELSEGQSTLNDASYISELLEDIADINASLSNKGRAVIHEACNKGKMPMVQKLLKEGANPNLRTKNGFTPLHLVCGFNMAKALLNSGADINSKANDGSTPLHVFCHYRKVSIVEYLLKRGADVNARDNDGFTPLQKVTIKPSNIRILKVLLKHGADINAKGRCGYTSLHQAIQNNYWHIATEFINQGADVNAKTDDGWTPLHLAALHDFTHGTELLLEHGANINAEGFNQTTPLHWAIKGGYEYVVEYFLDHGADINAKLKDGCTPLTLARLFGNLNVVKILLTRSGKLT